MNMNIVLNNNNINNCYININIDLMQYSLI